jgi:hypothetical protein
VFFLLAFISPAPLWAQATTAGTHTGATHPAHSSAAVSFDLSSSSQTIKVGQHLLPGSATAAITAAGQQQQIKVGDYVTPAQLAALIQVMTGGQQTLVLDASDRAVGGTLSLAGLPMRHISSLVIPAGVLAIDPACKYGLNLTGGLTANGTLLGVPTASAGGVLSITAGLILVGTTGSIMTQPLLNASGQPVVAGQVLGLSLNSLSDIINAGSIISGGTLSLTAAGKIVNVVSPGGAVSQTAVIAGQQFVQLFSGSGVIQNSGLIASQNGSVSFNTAPGKDLLINNTAGTIQASLGSIALRDQAFQAASLTQLIGGVLTARSINISGGNGPVQVLTDRITGPINVSGATATITAASGDLDLVSLNLTGDPTIINTGGDVTLPANADGGQTLRFAGQDLSVLASGNINAPAALTLIDLSSGSGSGGNLTLIAGYNFSPSTSGSQRQEPPNPLTYTLGAPSLNGGNINLPSVAIDTSSSASGGVRGGSINIIAHDGTATTGAGIVSIGAIKASSPSGPSGNVLVAAEGAITANGTINTAGQSSGSISIEGGLPQAGGTVTFNNGTASGISSFQIGADTGHAPVAVNIAGSISTGGAVAIMTSGDVTLQPGQGITAAGPISIVSSEGGISFAGNNHLSTPQAIYAEALGSGSSVSIHSGASLSAGQDIFIASYNGGIQDSGGNTYNSLAGSTILASLNTLTLGGGTSIYAGQVLGLLSADGAVTSGTGVQLVSAGPMGILGGNGVAIGASSLIQAGVLNITAPAQGVLSFSDIASPGFIVVGSGAGINLQSSLTANGGDLVVAGLAGNLDLGPGIQLQANGGYLALFASGTVAGSNEVFYARAAGSKAFFTGGLIDISSGFSFHPDLVDLGASFAANRAEIAANRSAIIAASAEIAQGVSNAQSNFVAPALDVNGFIADSTIAGHNVHVTDNGLQAGLLQFNKIGGGTVDLTNSAIDITRGAVFVDSVGASAKVSLPGAILKVESHGVVPTGLFTDYVATVAAAFVEHDFVPPQDTIDSVVTPADQNQIVNNLNKAASDDESENQVAPVPGDADISGEQLAGTTPGDSEGEDDAITNQPIVDIFGEAEGRWPAGSSSAASDKESGTEGGVKLAAIGLGSSRGGKTDEESSQGQNGTGKDNPAVPGARPGGLPNIARQGERVLGLGVPQVARGGTFHVQPIIRVAHGHSELTIFTTMSQVLTGVKGARSDSITVGSAGTTVSVAGDGIVLHTGKLLADNGKDELTVKTRSGNVKIGSQSTAEIIDEPGAPVRVRALSGGQSAVAVETEGGAGSTARSIALGPGEEVVLSPKHVYIASASRSVSDVPAGGLRSIDESLKKLSFSIEQLAATDELVGSRSIRLSGAKRADYERLITHLSQTASAQQFDFQNLKAAPAMGSTAAGDPPRLLAAEGTMFTQNAAGDVVLKSGTIFLQVSTPMAIKTGIGTVNLRPDSMVCVDYRRGKLRAYSLSGPRAVSAAAANHSFELPPGRELLLLSHRPTKSEALPQDGVGRRRLAAHSLTKRLSAVTGDFSITSLLSSASFLEPLTRPQNERNRAARHRLIKVAAAVEMATAGKGRYFVQAKETAQIPEWAFLPLVCEKSGF